MHPISHDPGNVCGQLCPGGDGVTRRLAAQEGNRISNDFVDIDQFLLRSALLEEHPDPADDLPRARSVPDDSCRSLARLFEIGPVACQPAQASIGIGDGGGNRLTHFVCQGGSQLSHGVHKVDALEIRLRLTQPLFGTLALDGDARKMGDLLDEIMV